MKDYYKTLGIANDASPGEIKKAYRRLARQFHPDVQHGVVNDPRFHEISEAYTTLTDLRKKREYDVARALPVSPLEMFSKTNGKRVIDTMLPHPELVSGKGADELVSIGVSLETLSQGGNIRLEHRGMKISLEIPPRAYEHPWCCMKLHGAPGINGGEGGDLYVYLYLNQQNKKGDNDGD